MHGCVIDIEATGLEAVGPGWILCAVIQALEGERTKVFRYDKLHDDQAEERNLLGAIFGELAQYQLWVGHNIEGYDWPMLKSRAYVLGVALPQPAFIYDTCSAFRRCQFRTVLNVKGKPTARLDHIVDFFNFKQQKTAILPQMHWRCVWGKGKEKAIAMDDLAQHCVDDVGMTVKAYWELIGHDEKGVIRRAR
jgi:DNA polymerase elongation subunit (family B)